MVDSSEDDVHVHVLPRRAGLINGCSSWRAGGPDLVSSELTNGTGSAVCGITPPRRILPRKDECAVRRGFSSLPELTRDIQKCAAFWSLPIFRRMAVMPSRMPGQWWSQAASCA